MNDIKSHYVVKFGMSSASPQAVTVPLELPEKTSKKELYLKLYGSKGR